MNLFEYENIGPEILQGCGKIERKMASLLMQKFEKKGRGFAYTKNIHQQQHV